MSAAMGIVDTVYRDYRDYQTEGMWERVYGEIRWGFWINYNTFIEYAAPKTASKTICRYKIRNGERQLTHAWVVNPAQVVLYHKHKKFMEDYYAAYLS